jgi:hypothetical protein
MLTPMTRAGGLPAKGSNGPMQLSMRRFSSGGRTGDCLSYFLLPTMMTDPLGVGPLPGKLRGESK